MTIDEPFHLACAIEYLSWHTTTLDLENPPLARAIENLGPYLAGVRPSGRDHPREDAADILSHARHLDRLVVLQRLGTLPFFLLACLVVGYWAGRSFGRPVAVLAVGLFTLLPTTLADAGLGTTDMALAATTGAAFLTIILWAEKPSWARALVAGLCTGLAFLSKFSALGYLTTSVLLASCCYWGLRRPTMLELKKAVAVRLGTLLVAVATVVVLFWAAYWFSFGPMHRLGINVPAPEYFHGLEILFKHNHVGHPSYLLGQTSQNGWWYYFPVALAVKTPIAFLMITVLGVVICLRRRDRLAYLLPMAFALGVLLPAMNSRIDIGIRHIAPIYLSLSIVSAIGLRELLQAGRYRLARSVAAIGLVGWMVISVGLQHPDYLAYFNGFAGKHPENILVDSNYDWGQDLKLLSTHLRQKGVQHIELGLFDPEIKNIYRETWYGLPEIHRVDDANPAPGWTVISTSFDKLRRSEEGPFFKVETPWYDQVAPTERLGPLLLFYVAPATHDHSTNAPLQPTSPVSAPDPTR